jgi:hypothetical protein
VEDSVNGHAHDIYFPHQTAEVSHIAVDVPIPLTRPFYSGRFLTGAWGWGRLADRWQKLSTLHVIRRVRLAADD